MTTVQWLAFALGPIVFAAWAFFMYRTLFRLRRRGADMSGQTFPGLGETLRQWGNWLTSPEDQRDRRILGGLTLLMVLWIAWNALRVQA